MNNLLLLLAAAAMIGAAIYAGHQGLVLRRINKTLKGVVDSLQAEKLFNAEAAKDADVYGSGWLIVDSLGRTKRVDPRAVQIDTRYWPPGGAES